MKIEKQKGKYFPSYSKNFNFLTFIQLLILHFYILKDISPNLILLFPDCQACRSNIVKRLMKTRNGVILCFPGANTQNYIENALGKSKINRCTTD